MSPLRIFLGLLLNPVLVLHGFNFLATILCHREAVQISGYPRGIDTYFQPQFSMENTHFGILFTLVMVMLHFALSGGYGVIRTRKRADSDSQEQ